MRAQEIDWTESTEGQLLQACASAKGTAGPDGWSSAEVRQLPPGVVAVFHKVSIRWLQSGLIPDTLRQAMQINLPKDNKIQGHRIAVEHTRPISVQSIWWRTFARAWLSMPCCKEWSGKFLHEDVLCQENSLGAEDAAAWLHDIWRGEHTGELCSLDWSKAFDHTNPVAVRTTLVNLGWPPSFCKILLQAQQHRRWVAWDSEIGDTPMQVATAIPQGCPLSPLVLAVVSSAGAYQTSDNPDIKQKIYMDDRSFWGKTEEAINQQIDKWKHFSRSIGFIENDAKLQRTTEHNEIKFLGVVTVRKPRCNHPDEAKGTSTS